MVKTARSRPKPRYGVDAARIQTESEGKLEAGQEGTAPGYDRRVDIVQLAVIDPI